jgi:hypothetical protein
LHSCASTRNQEVVAAGIFGNAALHGPLTARHGSAVRSRLWRS